MEDYIYDQIKEETDIEPEDNSIEDIHGPFDPNAIDVDISVVNLGSLLEQLEYNEIDLQPEFQRESDVWTQVKKSRLIESVLLGLPLPSFYFSEDPETNKLLVVDGLQRLCAFSDFCITKKLKLKGMQFLTGLEGWTYDKLDRTQIRRIKSLKVTLNTLRKNTPQRVKLVIFQRVNTAGVPLTSQEMRNALYQKKATDLLKRMVKLDSFRKATGGKIPSKRMTDCDFANRFVAFYLYRKEYDGNLDEFMGDALENINRMSQQEIDSIHDTFDRSMTICYRLLGNTAFKRPDPQKPNSFLKTNKAIFEVLGVSIAQLSENEQEILVQRKDRFQNEIYSLFMNEDFIKSITAGTAKTPQVEYRHTKVQQLIKQVIGYDNSFDIEGL
ncbi:MAG: DUF262 domain-containing protein [Bacteroidales bacterium]|nr:DUF262 domain-containing protein [Bacteroidales bacterium]